MWVMMKCHGLDNFIGQAPQLQQATPDVGVVATQHILFYL
jgi:hypothetical protein